MGSHKDGCPEKQAKCNIKNMINTNMCQNNNIILNIYILKTAKTVKCKKKVSYKFNHWKNILKLKKRK